MDSFNFDYRDPVFGFILIFILLFLATFLTYIYNLFSAKKSRKEYKKLLTKFELNTLEDEDYMHLYSTYKLPFDSILLLASTFLYKGNNNKAISVYLALLKHVQNKKEKEELLELLGKTYYKSGFLQRSENIYLKILKFSPHNVNALNSLLLIYEKLKNYKMSKEVILSLSELNQETTRENVYIDALIIIDDSMLSVNEKTIQLVELYESNRLIQRLLLEYLLTYNKKYFWKAITSFDLSSVIDLLWYIDFDDVNFDVVDNNPLLEELYTAKSYLKRAKKSEVFEFNVLIATNNYENKINIDLNFDFVCTQCKKIHPIYANRCPHCTSILTLNVKANLAKSYYEKNSSLQ